MMGDMMGYTPLKRYGLCRFDNGDVAIDLQPEKENGWIRLQKDFKSAYTCAVDMMHTYRKCYHPELTGDNWVIIGTEFHVTLYRKD